MSSTTKERLVPVLEGLDNLFAKAHPADREDLIKELRSYLNLQRTAEARPAYDRHSNHATG